MLQFISKKSRNIQRLLVVLLLIVCSQPVFAQGAPAPSIFDNTLAVTLIVLMILLLIIIAILAYILIGAADLRVRKNKKTQSTPAVSPSIAASLVTILLMSSSALFAQGGSTPASTNTTNAATTISGMSSGTFWIMASVIFLELLIIIAMLLNIRILLKAEREKFAEPAAETAEAIAAKRNRLTWWDRFNKLRPVSQEADLDLGHDYDGIRELNNRLPPWWLYGFYATIIFAAVYLWRFHVSHTGPSSKEEYERAVADADLKVKEYLKMKGDNVDENTVTFLSSKDDLEAGKELFTNGPCVSCHGKDGSGIVMGQPGVGPNLTDDYWLHGGSIKNIFTTIKYGVAGKGMQSWESTFSAKQIAQLASYVKSLHGTNPKPAKDKQGELYTDEPVKPATDSLKNINDSLKTKDNNVAVN
jgi:cytochrome c oxidase cbb3-type subunit 3